MSVAKITHAGNAKEELYIRENQFVYKFGGEASVYRDYFFKDPGGRKGFGNQSRCSLDTFFSKSAMSTCFSKVISFQMGLALLQSSEQLTQLTFQ